MSRTSRRLEDVSPELQRILMRSVDVPARFKPSQIVCTTVDVVMRDGVVLVTDIYLPPEHQAPTVAMRTPYGRARDGLVGTFLALARRGFAVVCQDCRGTGESEPDTWDYYMREPEDGLDLVDWICRQEWFGGFLGSCGGSYDAQTQWCMAMHPRMSAVVPQVSGLGFAVNTVHQYMFCNAYARTMGKGKDRIQAHYTEMERLIEQETMSGGYFNEPLHQPLPEPLLKRYPDLRTLPPVEVKRRLWASYCSLSCRQRAEFVKRAFGTDAVSILEVESLATIFGHRIAHDAHTLPHNDPPELCRLLHAPALMVTGWYDWGLNDALATFQMLSHAAQSNVNSRSRLIIGPSAHNMPGYHEGIERHSELQHNHSTLNNLPLLLKWYFAVRDAQLDAWPRIIYYMMGANEWRTAESWPLSEAKSVCLYLRAGNGLSTQAPKGAAYYPDVYHYDPIDPTPTVGGSIVSYVYPVGSVDVSEVQRRTDVVVYSTDLLERSVEVAGPLRLVLYASSSALDTDFSARLSDVFPDGRAVQIQSGILRARYRGEDPELLKPGQVYRFEIDMWATANCFKAGHRIRLDISSADFPRFDRNTNRGGEPGSPVVAVQKIFHDPEHPSHLLLPVLGDASALDASSI